MSTHKNFDRVCVVVLVLCLLLTAVFVNGDALGLEAAGTAMGYETRLFDTSRVHTIDIVMDDWDAFIDTAQSEEYAVCSVVIDGEAFQTVGIRGKGNTSLSTVSSMDSERYSFKIEFDQYDTGKTYHGLDKLSLNNVIQDTTYMKDYLTYRMMTEFGAAAPLCSYAYITVNGEDWGLYLAVEGVEESFLQRNYGSDYGELYKPDSMNFGGGRGNGKDFNMEDFMASAEESGAGTTEQAAAPDRSGLAAMGDEQQMGSRGSFEFSGGIGSGDARLQYVDDDPSSYSVIFDSAKTDVSDADQARLIGSLRQLSSGNVEESVDVEAVLRYFVVHNYVVNGDSYTGSMIHNYYLYEEDGKLSMLPWDYNLAYGTFQGGDADSSVNDDIDSPLSVTGSGDRPMADWIFQSEEYTALYHQYFASFLETVDIQRIIDEAYALIAPYVERDPTAFYSYEEFETGVAALKEFCLLRSQSVRNQLDGSGETVDASQLNLSDMGSMGMGGGGFDRGGRSDGGSFPEMPSGETMQPAVTPEDTELPEGESKPPDGMTMPEGAEMPGGASLPETGDFPAQGEMSAGQTGAQMGQPGGFPGAPQTGSGAAWPSGLPQMPEGMEQPADRSGQASDAGSFPDAAEASGGGAGSLLLLGGSVLVLLVGLLVAAVYKRRR